MRARVFAVRVVGAALMVLLSRAAPSIAQDDATIVIAGTANDSGGEIFYAKDLGLFEKAGLKVDVQAFNNPGATAAGVVGGTLTVAAMTVPGIAAARESGLPIKIIAPSSIYSSAMPTSGIIVLKNSAIKKASDLNGKTIATRDISNMSYYGAKAWIDKNGGDSKTIKWVEVNDPQTVAAMKAGRVDAASVSEPALDDAIHGPDARLLAACYTEDYARMHPDIVRKINVIILAAGAWANKNHAQSAKILEKYSGVPMLPGYTRVTYAERMRPADVQPVLDLLANYGVLKVPMRATDLFAPQVP
jgi:ABC-type nitrate/sulfonate/bicarbonate transport system substrate-binding protein